MISSKFQCSRIFKVIELMNLDKSWLMSWYKSHVVMSFSWQGIDWFWGKIIVFFCEESKSAVIQCANTLMYNSFTFMINLSFSVFVLICNGDIERLSTHSKSWRLPETHHVVYSSILCWCCQRWLFFHDIYTYIW